MLVPARSGQLADPPVQAGVEREAREVGGVAGRAGPVGRERQDGQAGQPVAPVRALPLAVRVEDLVRPGGVVRVGDRQLRPLGSVARRGGPRRPRSGRAAAAPPTTRRPRGSSSSAAACRCPSGPEQRRVAERLVPGHDVGDRRVQRASVSTSDHRMANAWSVPPRVVALHRRGHRPRCVRRARTGRAAAVSPSRSASVATVGASKTSRIVRSAPKVRTDPAAQPHRGHRVAAEGEEVVVHAHRRQAEHARRTPGPAAAAPGVAGRSSPASADQSTAGSARRSSFPLGVNGSGPSSGHQRRGHHVLGQVARQVRAQLHRVHHPRGRRHVADQPGERGGPVGHHGGLAHRRVPRQRRLDLARLDAEPAHLHLVVGPAQEVQHAVAPPPRPVAGAVHACPGGRTGTPRTARRSARGARGSRGPARARRRTARRRRPAAPARSRSSSTYTRVFGSGTPIGTGPVHAGSACHSVEFTVASVRPYAASTFSRPAQRPIRSGGTVSVPTRIVAPAGSARVLRQRGHQRRRQDQVRHPLAVQELASARGPRCAPPPAPARACRRRTAPSSARTPPRRSRPTRTAAPGCPARSRIRSIAVAASDAMPSCGTTTPLGRPVDPDV